MSVLSFLWRKIEKQVVCDESLRVVETSGMVEVHRSQCALSQDGPIRVTRGRMGAGSKGTPVRFRLQRGHLPTQEELACLCGTGRLKLRMEIVRGRGSS